MCSDDRGNSSHSTYGKNPPETAVFRVVACYCQFGSAESKFGFSACIWRKGA